MSNTDEASPVQGDVMFYACPWNEHWHGYPVRYLKGFLVAAFVMENEAQDYAKYRNAALAKHDTTDTGVIEHNAGIHGPA